MIRSYSSGQFHTVNYFVGQEIENVPTKGAKTLFVATPDIDLDKLRLYAELEQTKVAYLGANHLFYEMDQGEYMRWWDELLPKLAELRTIFEHAIIDFPSKLYGETEVQMNLIDDIDEYEFIIPLMSIKAPRVMRNLNIKVDDETFNYSNPGVWVTSLYKIEESGGFTPWDLYYTDKVLD